MLYQLNPSTDFLERYAPLVAESAAFMADFAYYDSTRQERVLGPGVIAAQERFGADTTFNTTFELAYWKWGLEVAQQWRERPGRGTARGLGPGVMYSSTITYCWKPSSRFTDFLWQTGRRNGGKRDTEFEGQEFIKR